MFIRNESPAEKIARNRVNQNRISQTVPGPRASRAPRRNMDAHTRFGPLKVALTGISAAAAAVLIIAGVLVSLLFGVVMFIVFIHNFWLISQGDFTLWNIIFVTISGLYLINAVADGSDAK